MNLLKYLQRAGVPETLQPEALASLQRAEEIASRVGPYKWTAPLVMAWVVPRLAWDAEALPARHAPLEDTPEARAQCYWAEGHHPRSRWARYVWLGWRNKASKLAKDLGAPIGAPIAFWGDENVGRAHPGVCVYRMGDHWQIMVVERHGPFIVRRNAGWKINNVLHNQHTVANITWLPWSLLKWKGA